MQNKSNQVLKWVKLPVVFWYFLPGKRRSLVLYICVINLILFYSLVPPYLMGQMVNFLSDYQTGDSLRWLYIICLLLGGSWTLVATIRLAVKQKLSLLGIQASYNARVQGFDQLLYQSMRSHELDAAGNKVKRVQALSDALRNLMDMSFEELFPLLAVFIGVLVSFIFTKPALFFFSLFYLCLFFAVQAYYYNRLQLVHQEFNIATERSSGAFYEGLSNLITIKTLGAEGNISRNLAEKEKAVQGHEVKITGLKYGKWQVFQIVNGLAMFGFALLLGRFVIAKTLSIGSVATFYVFFEKLIDAAGKSGDRFNRLIEMKTVIERGMPLYWATLQNLDQTHGFPKDWREIKLDQISFGYSNKFVLDNLSLQISRGSKIGLVGHSGSGKSTLAKLLMGLYQFDQGRYLIDDLDFNQIQPSEISQYYSMVLQDMELFNLSLRDNITLMRESSEEVLFRAVALAQLENLIASLPEGLNTSIGEKGYRLSGGEKQRVALARAIYKQPNILILDEATSALDSATEALIQNAIETQLKETTLITIAHRLSTLSNVDTIYVLDQGRIIESGTFAELLENSKGHFKKLYDLQNKT